MNAHIRFASLVVVSLALAAVTGCGSDAEGKDAAAQGATGGSGAGGDGANSGSGGGGQLAPGEWQGVSPHLALSGSVGGQAVELSASGAEAADLGTLYCERNYIVPDLEDASTWQDGHLEKVEFKFNFFFQDQLAEFQLELERDALPTVVGETLSLGPDELAGVALGLKVDPDGPDEVEYEDVATGGSARLELLSGAAGEDGVVIPDSTGAFGGYVELELESGGTLRGSFTATCGDNDLETPEA